MSNSLPKVLITNWVPDEHLEPLHGIAQIIKGPENGRLMTREEVLELAPELSGIINQHELQVDAPLLQCAPKLQVVANVAAGYDNLDLQALEAAKVWATNTPGIFTDATAEHTIALIFSLMTRVTEADRYVRSGFWKQDGFEPGRWDGFLLKERSLGIIGYGAIGKRVAKLARGLGIKVRFFNRSNKGDEGFSDLDTLLSSSDVVTIHMPLTNETHHLMNADTIGRMKPGSFLINMARGPLVDEQALVDALNSDHLAGAGLDVFENEPEPHPELCAMPNVVLTPHAGGGTRESRKAARILAAKNIAMALSGTTPLNALTL